MKTLCSHSRANPRKAHPKPFVSIIIPNYDGKTKLGRLFYENMLSVTLQTYDRYEIIIVDNGSSDDSIAFISEKFPSIRTIKLNENCGFARVCNIGVRESKGEILIFLNNDTIVPSSFLERVVECFEAHEDAGIVQPEILNTDDPIKLKTCHVGVEGQPKPVCSHPSELPYATGAAMAIRRDVFLNAGNFDPIFFFYGEDVDISLKIRGLGYKVLLCPSLILHKGSGTVGKERSSEYIFYSEKARLIILFRYLNVSAMFPLLGTMLIMFHAGLIVHYLLAKRARCAISVIKAWFSVLKGLKNSIKLTTRVNISLSRDGALKYINELIGLNGK